MPTVTVPAPISISGTHLNLVLNLQISSSQGNSACSALYAPPPPGSNETGGEAYEFLREVARANDVHVHGGSIAERAGAHNGNGV